MNSAIPAALGSISPNCLIPGCDGYGHVDGICETVLDSMPVVVGDLTITVNAGDERPFELVVWNDSGDLLRTTTPAEAAEFADRIRAFAAAVDKGAALLAADNLSAAKPEPVDYAARFEALDEYRLYALEGDSEDCTAASEYLKSLLIVLADWRPRIVAMLADAPAWSIPEVAAYERAVNRVQEAWTLYSFRYDGGPDLPETFDLPKPKGHAQAVAPVARIVSAGRRDLLVREIAA